MQDSELLRKLNQVLTKRFLRFLNEQSNKNEEIYLEFWNEFGHQSKRAWPLISLIRMTLPNYFFSNQPLLNQEKLTGLDAYVDRMASEQKEILFSLVKVENPLKLVLISKPSKQEV